VKQQVGFDSHCLRAADPHPTALIDLCTKNGFSSLGLYHRHFTGASPTASTMIGAQAHSHGLRLALCAVPLKESLSCRASNKTLLEWVLPQVETAVRMKAFVLRAYCFELGERERDFSTISINEFYGTLRILCDTAKQHGLMVTLENHGDFLSEDIMRACEKVHGLRVCFDFSNQFAVGESTADAIDRLLPLISLVHLKDAVFEIVENHVFWRSVPLGKGSLDLESYIRRVSFLDRSALMLEASTSGGRRQAGRSVGSVREKFIDFCSAKSTYSPEFDTYVTRGGPCAEALIAQEWQHLEQSVMWLKRHELL
jgi:sugar phosphate isomerase/epimerase